MKLYCNEIYTEKGCIHGILHVENGVFKMIEAISETLDENVIDVSNYRILPGIIDIHTHGWMTYSSQSTSVENYHNLSKCMASQGVTGFLVTAGEHNQNEMEGLSAIADVIEEGVPGAQILGIHMEGPFLNPHKKGAFMDEQLLPINIETMKAYIKASRNHIRYVALAPELDPDGTFIRFLKEHDILVAGGHTTSSYAEYTRAIQQGLDASTHTGNAMNQIDRRNVQALGAALLHEDLYSEMICDFIHIAPEMISIYLRIKDKHKWMMISDSGQLSGLPPGRYNIHNQVRNIKEDGRIILDDGGIAGSSKSILWGMRCLEQVLHVPMEEIVLMSSSNQANFLGIQDMKGSIAEGKEADFFILDKDYQVIQTYVKGICVFDHKYTKLNMDITNIKKVIM